MDSNAISNILGVILILLIALLMILSVVFLILKGKESANKRKEKNTSNKTNSNNGVKKTDTKAAITYNKKSIFDFMEFDSITDNMIVQKDGRRLNRIRDIRIGKDNRKRGKACFLNSM